MLDVYSPSPAPDAGYAAPGAVAVGVGADHEHGSELATPPVFSRSSSVAIGGLLFVERPGMSAAPPQVVERERISGFEGFTLRGDSARDSRDVAVESDSLAATCVTEEQALSGGVPMPQELSAS